jgi:hypothetical protein
MASLTIEFLREQLKLGEELLAKRGSMFTPQDLPGRYGRAVKAVDHLLQILGCAAVVAGGWAVWRHGYFGRMTQDLDIVLPRDQVADFLRLAAVSGFEVIPQPEVRWPKIRHKDTDVFVDVLPEGGRPGTPNRLAPTTIPHPAALGATGTTLKYINLPALIELKLAAGRPRDEADVTEILRSNVDQAATIREHLAAIHAMYVERFDYLLERAREQLDA